MVGQPIFVSPQHDIHVVVKIITHQIQCLVTIVVKLTSRVDGLVFNIIYLFVVQQHLAFPHHHKIAQLDDPTCVH